MKVSAVQILSIAFVCITSATGLNSTVSLRGRKLNNGNGNGNGNSNGNGNNKKRILVKYMKGKKDSVKGNIAGLGANFVHEFDGIDLFAVELPEPAIEALLKNKNKDIELIEEDPFVYPIETILEDSPEDRRRLQAQSTPWGISKVNADKVEQTGAGVTVCVIDTGIASSHPDLQLGTRMDGEIKNGVDWSVDGCGHGTHVAGTIVAQNNTIGVVGVAPDANVYIVKVFYENQGCDYAYGSDVLYAAHACRDGGASIVSMSLGGNFSSTSLAYGWERLLMDDNVLAIAAAGNDGNTAFSYPASHVAVVSVAAVNSNNAVASFSQKNSRVDIAAPGVSVRSTVAAGTYGFSNHGYGSLSGTSMATPHVAGVAALIWQKYPTFTALQVRQQMLSTAFDLGVEDRDDSYGHGLVNASAAMSPACSVDNDCNDGDDECTTDVCVDNICYWNVDPICGFTELSPSTPISLSLPAGEEEIFWVRVSSGDSATCTISGNSGDADLYTRLDEFPTIGVFDCRPYLWGSTETCSYSSIGSGHDYLFVMVRAYEAFTGVTLQCVGPCVSDGTCSPNVGFNCGTDAPGTDSCGRPCTVTEDLGSCSTGNVCVSNTCERNPNYGQLQFLSVNNVNVNWVTVNLKEGFRNPVPVCTVEYKDGVNLKPTVVRMRNVQPSSFEIRLQNPSDDQNLTNLKISCIVVEEGSYETYGVRIEARKMISTTTAPFWSTNFENAPTDLSTFANPVIMGQVMTYNDSKWSAFIATGNDFRDIPSPTNGFRISKHVGQDGDRVRSDETLGYIVIEALHSSVFDIELEAGVTSDTIGGYSTSGWNYAFNSPFTIGAPDIVIVTQNGMDGGDGSWGVVLDSTSATTLKVLVDEDQVFDAERAHTTEQVSYMAFARSSGATDLIELQATENIGNCGNGDVYVSNSCQRDPSYGQLQFLSVDNVDSAWMTVTVEDGFINPVPVCTVEYKNGVDLEPVVVRMRNVQPSSFDIRLQNPSNDVSLTKLKVTCLVVEEGVYQTDGLHIEARKMTSTTTAPSWSNFENAPTDLSSFTKPVVLGQVLTFNDSRWSAFIAAGNSVFDIPSPTNGFRVSKHVGQDTDTARADETLGYIVIEALHASVFGIELEAGVTSDTIGGYRTIGWNYNFDGAFTTATPDNVIITQNGMDGGDGSWGVALDSTSATTLNVLVDEDQIRDAERSHTTEQVSYIAFAQSSGAPNLIVLHT